jgi:predicted transcriptional regulator
MIEPELTSVFELEPDEAHEARLDAEAEAAYAAGRFVPHEKVAEWLTKIANGERVPRPKP